MAKFKALSRGTKLVLVAGPLLFLSLFFDWQNLKVDYGPAGIAELPQDGWDAWGLLVALLVSAAVTIVVLQQLTDVELSEQVPWDRIVLGLGTATFAAVLLKNLRDADSSWSSYGFVGFAAVFALGTYLRWDEARADRRSFVGRGRFSSAA